MGIYSTCNNNKYFNNNNIDFIFDQKRVYADKCQLVGIYIFFISLLSLSWEILEMF